MKITYTQYGDYYLPDLELPAGGREIGIWGAGVRWTPLSEAQKHRPSRKARPAAQAIY